MTSTSSQEGLPLPKSTERLTRSIPKTTLKPSSSTTPESSQPASEPQDWLPIMRSKQTSKYTDPCAHAAKASMKCMEDNQYDRGKCMRQFQDYRDCKKTWVLKRRNDRFDNREGAFD
ncbi:unnamed protein product [Sympodiomycopsis kandeliae]